MAMSSPQSASTTPPAMTIPTLLAQRAAAHPDKAFIVDGDTTLSYGHTLERVRALGCWLVQQGCKPGDRVAGFVPNMPETI
ncbi:MAG: AMP-binding protein, partial [Luminiphilus sp.]